ncbi:hypothetical protein GA0115254_10956 [Streptomyces sp. Ncost-T10-10d]|nr:hypothetical protein GA0115254_10956 [Streptomyces sp. Ncost-T10-10d]
MRMETPAVARSPLACLPNWLAGPPAGIWVFTDLRMTQCELRRLIGESIVGAGRV